MRPQLTADQAAAFSWSEVLRYVGPAGADRVDPWVPSRINVDELVPDYIVGQGGTCTTVQEAINRAITDRKVGRVVIGVAPGLHMGLIYVPHAAFQMTLMGLGKRPADVRLVESIDAEMPGSEYVARFAAHFQDSPNEVLKIYQRISKLTPISTANASVLRVENDGFQLANLTVRNAYYCDRAQSGSSEKNAAGQYRKGQHQAVALLVAGADRVFVQDVILKSFQDTLYLQSPSKGETVRSCFNGCEIEGDVDFIFGQSTAWFEGCTIRSLGGRAPQTWATAPSTDIRTRFGFVFEDCDFTHSGSTDTDFFLGRQWFEGVRATPFGTPDIDNYSVVIGAVSSFDLPHGTISTATLNAVGKCVIMRSRIGGHIDASAPWDAWGGNTWNPRHRPVLYRAADMLDPLRCWLRDQGQSYADIAPDMQFLAEFENVSCCPTDG
ncbi:pectinesterase family protein [Loktanella agnita]|uniref:pectinesterase family protein n=1 Tax=Loktanella agnita TaxID=287097 RepID=UPI003989764D